MWTRDEEDALRVLYSGEEAIIDLRAFAAGMGRNSANVCRKAKSLGLPVNQARPKVIERKSRSRARFEAPEDRSAFRAEFMKARHARDGHPMRGRKHTQEALARIAEASRETWERMTEEDRAAHTDKALKAKIEKYGHIAPNVGRGKWKAGWREFGGRRVFFRSRWEANYGRYLEWLRENGHIKDWQHEPETFWFDKIKRGVRSYLSDFRVYENDGTSNLHEVKGWMDARSKTTLKRMAKYHPTETIILIKEKQYREIERKVGPLIDGWEF